MQVIKTLGAGTLIKIIYFLLFKFLNKILARAVRNIATEPWFIGLMVALALLIIILINVCVLVRERGGKYSGKR